MPQFKDDSYSVIKSDIERLRQKTSMYISNTGAKGALHLCKEAINNAIDEAMSDLSPCDRIEIELDGNLNQLTVMDNGRGIPFEQVKTICTFLHSGSNINKENEKENAAEVAGENGVGVTAINALSKKLYFVIRRNGQKGFFEFKDAQMQEPIMEKCSKKEHGTAIVFVPDEKYLGKCKIDEKALKEWIDAISYTVPSHLHITFNYIKKGKDIPVTTEFHHPKGIEELIQQMAPEQMTKPIHVCQSPDRYTDGKTHSDVIYTIGEGDISDAKNQRSYCNRVITIDGGSHVEAAKTAWCKAVLKMSDEYMSEKEKDKLSLTFEDCRVGLTFAIVLNTPVPGFTGQTKQKVDNDEVYKALRKTITEDLIAYFHKNPTDAKRIVGIVKRSAKERQSAIKIRKSDYKSYDNFEANTSKVYAPCSSNKYAELWIMEGDSAKGGFTGFRDARYQAAFKLKGNPKNVYGCSLGEVLQNDELRALTKVLGCGVGKDFRLKNLKFDKIIFFVDSDIDGWNMVSLLSTYFLCILPEVVKAGKVYRAMAPFYIMKDKNHPYLLSKNEYYHLFAKNVSKKMHLIRLKDGKRLSDKQMYDLIEANKDYLEELQSLVKYYATDNEIIEFAILHAREHDFGKMLHKKFDELTYDERKGIISGSMNQTYQYLEIDKPFFSRTKRLADIIHKVDNGEIYYDIDDNGIRLGKPISLGTFFMKNTKYLPKVDRRIKGIGELPGEVLWKTTLDPEHRQLTRLTIQDLEQELETVKVLHGPDTELRKDFMEDYAFNKDDLDT